MKTALVIMAAGMGSRFGGLKQMTPLGPSGQTILEYSVYDAAAAGFDKAVLIIKKENEDDFRELVGRRIERLIDVEYVFQCADDLPSGYSVPAGRVKPWGTGHAVRAARGVVDTPFAVINADDYYGQSAFKVMYDYLASAKDGQLYDYCMVGYLLGNTVTENGSVARGICSINADQTLASVVERTQIEKYDGGIHFTEDGGATWTDVTADTVVSMNMWGYTSSFLKEIEEEFPKFLAEKVPANPAKAEFFLPMTVGRLLQEKKASVKVLQSADKWYGVTYAADKPVVVDALQEMTAQGKYPDGLWN